LLNPREILGRYQSRIWIVGEDTDHDTAETRIVCIAMPILRNADRAIIDERKVRDYLLNPLHARGGHKARIFAAALGYRRFDHARLIQRIKEGILRHEAHLVDTMPHGERLRVEIPITGHTGSAIVRTLWIVRTDEDVPRLTSAYPIK
jgi:hypothetical protein